MKRNASVTWSGSARDGRGTFRVGSGALTAPFTYNSRFRGDGETNPRGAPALGISRLPDHGYGRGAAGKGNGGEIETSAELDLIPHESGGYRIPSMRVEIAVAGGGSQDQLDLALSRAIEMCPICNALAGTDIRLTVRRAG